MTSRRRNCADLTGPGIEPQTSRTDGVRSTTELTGRCSHVPPGEKESDCFTRKASKGRFLLLVVWTFYLQLACGPQSFVKPNSPRPTKNCEKVHSWAAAHRLQTTALSASSYRCKPPARSTIRAWHEKFTETGSVLHRQGAGRPPTSEEIESVRVAYTRSPRKTIRRLLLNCRSHAPLFTKFCIEICNFMHIQ